ncbi:tripartite tricarboxylate transporter substrate binding protein [Pararhodobacter sp.]|uniref:tripartite tricarboxylate transporter substrate binding protein n=1 Tax=Pararhodobacter sp. TaxID=2127056 RepID=UPI002AFDEEA6|nr:tripartite tricarboxylate transporter substrate binding protein [Pararhodobacter sp.]
MTLTTLMKAAVTAAAFAMPGAALADWTPAGPITLQIGFGAGGSTDTLGRAIAAAVEENTGWDVIVENRPGGGGIAMLSTLMNEDPDGLTIGMGVTVATVMNLAMRGDQLPFTIESFDYLGTVVLAPVSVVAVSSAPYDTFAEFIDYSIENGGSLVGFDGGPQRLIMQSINNTTGSQVELVSHQSGAEIITGLLGGQLDAGFSAGEHIQYLESGDLKMLAVATQARHPYSPDTQTLVEQGYPYSVEPYFYLAAPAGLEPEVQAALAGAIADAIQSEELVELIENVMQTEATNLGPDGTEAKLTSGLGDAQALIAAAAE